MSGLTDSGAPGHVAPGVAAVNGMDTLHVERVIRDSPIPAMLVRFEDDQSWQVRSTNRAFRGAFGGASAACGIPLDAYFQFESRLRERTPPTGSFHIDATTDSRHGPVTPVRLTFSEPVIADARIRVLYVQAADRQSLVVAAVRAREKFQAFFDDGPDINYILDHEGTLVDINEGGARQLGYTRTELISGTYTAQIHADDQSFVDRMFERVLQGETLRLEARFVRRDRSIMIASILARPNLRDGVIIGLFGVAQDITERRLTQVRLEESEQRYRALFVDHIDAVITTDCEGNFLRTNPAFEHMIHQNASDLIGTHFLPLVVPELRDYTHAQFSTAVAGHTVEYKTRIADAASNEIDLHVTLIPVIVDGHVAEIHCIAKDITALEKANLHLERMAFTHHLTGLPNRNALDEHLSHLVELGAMFSVHNLDLDRLKAVNDRYGRDTGDSLLKAVAGRLSGFVTAPTRLFQYGADNFVIVHQHTHDHEAFEYASMLEKLFRAPFALNGEQLVISASIGVCVYPRYGNDPETLLRRSEDAMLEAKRRGRSHIAFYRELADDQDSRLLKLEFALRHAIEHEELSVVYQPQIELSTGAVHGVEALLRWTHPELGPVTPAEFIPIAERNGIIHDLGMWVLETACEQLAVWEASGYARLRMAVNVSIDQFFDAEFSDRIQRAIAASGIAPSSLVLEVTESIAASAERVIAQLHQLKSLGVSIALDDFGTGYSSLRYLRDFPVDYLKIDRSFIHGIEGHDGDRGIVATINELARNFGLFTIAEGVETVEQLRRLQALGVPFVQGYHISRPLPPDEFAAWGRARRPAESHEAPG